MKYKEDLLICKNIEFNNYTDFYNNNPIIILNL